MLKALNSRKNPSDIEWVGGRYTLANDVVDGDFSFRPDLILWLELPAGMLLATTVVNPRDPASAAESLEQVLHHPDEGPPRRPRRIRVADERFAEELSGATDGIPIVIAPVPELDAAFHELEAMEMASRATEPSYLVDGEIPAPLVEALFETASLLFRAAPWRQISDQQVLRVDIPHFGVDRAVLCVIGAAGENFGLLLFNSLADYDSFIYEPPEEDEAHDEQPDRGVTLRSLSFDAKQDLPPSLLREIEQHRWPVAGPNAYPTLLCVGADRSARPITAKEARLMIAVTRAFLAFFGSHREIFDSDDPETIRESSEGEDGVKVTLTAPYTDYKKP